MNNEPFGLRTSSGVEAISDDRKLKLILRRQVFYAHHVEQVTYVSYCYVKDDAGWEKTTNTAQYPSVESFVGAIGKLPEFTIASRDLSTANHDH